ncbi:ribosome biogenesis protein Rlp7p [Diutina catenulata]
MAILNSNPEILLRKRKDKDRKRLQKQEELRERQKAEERLKKKKAANKFMRPETLIAHHKSTELEEKRVRSLQKKIEINSDLPDDSPYKLLFVIRVPDHAKGIKIPTKARQLLTVLKLEEVDTGVFVKANDSTIGLLGYIAPYIMVGEPSHASVRKLFQKRGRYTTPEGEVAKLDNNQAVEDKFEDDLGLICIEDVIHELTSLSDNFNTITSWLLPFKLNAPVNGWSPRAKLAKLMHQEANKRSISMARDFRLQEVDDIDGIIETQN